ncbi:sugar ABC transporter substrate-binding protein [Paenibacillus alkalitolerans]|uniref:sugar ABC transporter substrate-binding protein n=1 Tax=Paenibacillus alkalitolerans TaxID=2799335 RepID=UPI002D7E552E|nr:maltose ABC transporter substrate-binding protein [Paenibacillus alkalitolerans]
MKMKPWFALILALVLAFSLAACGGSNATEENDAAGGDQASAEPANQEAENTGETDELTPEDGAKLVVWESQEEKPFIEEVGKRFEEKYGVPVTVEVVPGGDQGGRLATDGPAGLAADILTLPHDQIGPAVTATLLLPNDIHEEETRNSMVEAAITASSYDGMLYGYPKSVETYALFYNKDLLPEAPKTWDEVIEFSKTFNDVNNKKYGIMWEVGNFYFGHIFFSGFGGYVFGDNGTNPEDFGLNNEGSVEGLKFMQSLKEILPVNTGDITWDVKTQLFTEGKLAMNIDGPWAVSSFRDKVNFGVAPLPKFPNGKDPISFSGVKSYYVNSYTKYPNAAKLFAQFASSKEIQLLNHEMTGIIPANKEANQDPVIVDNPIVSGFSQQFVNSTPMPSIPAMRDVWEPGAGALTTVWNDGADVKATLDTNANTIKEKIKAAQ